MVIDNDAFFNDHTINVFTDASVKNYGQVFESVAGAIIVKGSIDTTINLYEDYIRLLPSTNNEGEIFAIYMAILQCVDIRNRSHGEYTTFNIFSDSRISVYGLREWYDSWIKNSNKISSDKLINSSGNEVKNQEIFIKCFNAILNNDIHINIYHIRGHIDLSKSDQYDIFVKDFKESNNIDADLTKDLIQNIVYFNDCVDNGSRSRLIHNGLCNYIPTVTAVQKDIPFDSFEGIEIKSDYLFTHDMAKISKEKRRYAKLIRLNTNFDNIGGNS